MKTCLIYSDASMRHQAIGHCCILDYQDGGQSECFSGDLTPAGSVVRAEIESLAIGLEKCREEIECAVAFTDLDWLPRYMAGTKLVSYGPKIIDSVERLKRAAAKFARVEWRDVNRNDSRYHECHCVSRREAVEAAKRRGTFNKVPISKTPKPTREELFWNRWQVRRRY